MTMTDDTTSTIPAASPYLNHAGLDWASAPEGGIYLWRRDASQSDLGRGGGGTMRDTKNTKIRGWGAGKIIPGDVKTSAQAIKAAGLNWLVDQYPAAGVKPGLDGAEQELILDPRRVVNVRRDNNEPLGIVGKNWTGPQNFEAFDFVDNLVDDGSAKWLGGGEADGGRRIFMLAQVAREIIVGGDQDERCLPLLFLSNGWDGGLAITVTVAPFRLACLNGMTIPLEGYARTWKAQHRSGINERMGEARRTLELSIGYITQFETLADQLITTKVDDGEFKRFLERLVPMPTTTDDTDSKGGKRALTNAIQMRALIDSCYRTSDDLANIKGTAWGVYNAVAEYADWHAPQRGARQEEQKLQRAMNDNPLKNKAFKMLMAV